MPGRRGSKRSRSVAAQAAAATDLGAPRLVDVKDYVHKHKQDVATLQSALAVHSFMRAPSVDPRIALPPAPQLRRRTGSHMRRCIPVQRRLNTDAALKADGGVKYRDTARSNKRQRVAWAVQYDAAEAEEGGSESAEIASSGAAFQSTPAQPVALHLPLHHWHAKRMHMKQIWGYHVPWSRQGRGSKAAMADAVSDVTVQDVSWTAGVFLTGTLAALIDVLARVSETEPIEPGVPHIAAGPAQLQGAEAGHLLLSAGGRAIAPVRCLWRGRYAPCGAEASKGPAGAFFSESAQRPGSTAELPGLAQHITSLALFLHPSALQTAHSSVSAACQGGVELPAALAGNGVHVAVRRSPWALFRLHGRRATQALQAAFERQAGASSDTHEHEWSKLSGLTNTSFAQGAAVLYCCLGLRHPSSFSADVAAGGGTPRSTAESQPLVTGGTRSASDLVTLEMDAVQVLRSAGPSGGTEAVSASAQGALPALAAAALTAADGSVQCLAKSARAMHVLPGPDAKRGSVRGAKARARRQAALPADAASNAAAAVLVSTLADSEPATAAEEAFWHPPRREPEGEVAPPCAAGQDTTVPVVLQCQPATAKAGAGGGWWVALPHRHAPALWATLQAAGAKAVGSQEAAAQALQARVPAFPQDFPDAPAGQAWWEEEGRKACAKWTRTPPQHKPNWTTLRQPSPYTPWAPPAENGHEGWSHVMVLRGLEAEEAAEDWTSAPPGAFVQVALKLQCGQGGALSLPGTLALPLPHEWEDWRARPAAQGPSEPRGTKGGCRPSHAAVGAVTSSVYVHSQCATLGMGIISVSALQASAAASAAFKPESSSAPASSPRAPAKGLSKSQRRKQRRQGSQSGSRAGRPFQVAWRVLVRGCQDQHWRKAWAFLPSSPPEGKQRPALQ